MNAIWFKNKHDKGIKHTEFYNPIPEVELALILTAVSPIQFVGLFQIYWWYHTYQIECCIDGTRCDVTFADDYQPIFTEHLKNLDKFDDHTKAQGLLPKLLAELHDNGRWVLCSPVMSWSNVLPCHSINAKADPLDHSTTRIMSPSAFDAAIEEFMNGDSSDSGGEHDDWFNVFEVCATQSLWAIYPSTPPQ